MAKSDPKKIELEPDAWQRFERAIDVVAKSPPQHRGARVAGAKHKASEPKKSVKKKRVRKAENSAR